MICRPGEDRLSDLATVRAVLRNQLSIKTVEMGSTTARLNASDVLFTGKEFFVAIGKETNTEGALVLANTWPEYPCTPVKVKRFAVPKVSQNNCPLCVQEARGLR